MKMDSLFTVIIIVPEDGDAEEILLVQCLRILLNILEIRVMFDRESHCLLKI